MEKEQKKELWGLIVMVILAGITVIGCISMPNFLLNGENVLGLKFMGTLVLMEGVFTTLALREQGILPSNPEMEGLLLSALDKLFSLMYLAAIIIVWSELTSLGSTWNIIFGGIWVTIYPFISVVETTVELLVQEEEDF